VQGHQLGSVGERRFDLDSVEHLGNAFHHIVAGQDLAAFFHEIYHGAAVSGTLKHPGGKQRNCFWMIEPQTPIAAPLGDISGNDHQEPLLFVGTELHGFAFLDRSGLVVLQALISAEYGGVNNPMAADGAVNHLGHTEVDGDRAE